MNSIISSLTKSFPRIRRSLRTMALLLAPFLIAGCIPEGITLPESPLLRNLERKSGLIAYVGTDYNIYTIDQGGGNQTAVTVDGSPPSTSSPTRIYQFPTWSPVDDRLAFVGISGPGGSIDDISVYTASPDGRNTQAISTHPDELSYYLYWTPDGENISFLALSENGSQQVLKMVSADGGETQVVDTGNPYYWDWSPDGRQLIIHEGSPPGGRISFIFPGDEIREEGTSHDPARFHAPAYSPDGQFVLLAVQDSSGADELILADSLGRKIRTLASYEGSVAFAWSPDGKKIAYITDQDLNTLGTLGPLTMLEIERPDEQQVISNGLVYAFFWSPDSEKLAYFEPTIPAEAVNSGSDSPPVFFRTFVRELGEADSELVTSFLPTDEFARMIPVFDQYHRTDTIWSPDSRFLVLSVIASNGNSSIWVVPASGAITPRYIADGLLAFWSWR
ncbi:MAG: hypothetical protein R3335_09135 [Anaerolineales bacterium]|nr:hypothetical protein [Anaerolineales bacterium]